MAKTLLQIRQQIAELKAVEERLRLKEARGVISRIREAIEVYSLTPEDLFSPRAAVEQKTRRQPRVSNEQAQPKFSDDSGNTWSGRGRKPGWLVAAVADGKSLEDFLSTRFSNSPSDSGTKNDVDAAKPKRQQKSALSTKAKKRTSHTDSANPVPASDTGTEATNPEVSRAGKQASGSTKKQKSVNIKYRDGVSSWTGRGSQPRWLKAALASGKSIEDFAV